MNLWNLYTCSFRSALNECETVFLRYYVSTCSFNFYSLFWRHEQFAAVSLTWLFLRELYSFFRLFGGCCFFLGGGAVPFLYLIKNNWFLIYLFNILLHHNFCLEICTNINARNDVNGCFLVRNLVKTSQVTLLPKLILWNFSSRRKIWYNKRYAIYARFSHTKRQNWYIISHFWHFEVVKLCLRYVLL